MESTTETDDVIPGYKSITEFTQNGFKVLVEATKNANALPQERNFDFYNAYDSFRKLMTNEGDTVLQLINTIVKEQGVVGNFVNRDLEEKLEVVVDANDSIFERVGINLDEVNGIRKNPLPKADIKEVRATLPVSGSWNKIENIKISSFVPNNEAGKSSMATNSIRLITGHNIQRPQKFFKDRVNNSHKFPWEPRIKDKPNSLKPLALFLEEDDIGDEAFSHPYEFELERFEPSADLLTNIVPRLPKPITDTPLVMVETEDDLNRVLDDLRNYKEIAIDVEHHSYRTFLGIACLMQISTYDTDYIVDTLSLRDKLHVLNEIFTKPTIVKILHGAESDIQWLQRDLSLYIVNMFDTFQAAKQLGYEQRSLKYLLKRFCGIDANKQFQLADWRIRPLPEELKSYAREDTHYLIYIYHRMRNELFELGNKSDNILKSVIQMSTDVCKIRYKKPVWREESHLDLYRKYKKLFDNKQMYCLKELFKWRDQIARDEDESIGYILPSHMLLQICEILPREMQGVLACCNPIPPLVRANLLEIHKIILRSREQSLIKAILQEAPRTRGSTQTVVRLNVENQLNCPHDMSHAKEVIDDLPTLLQTKLKRSNISEDIRDVKIEKTDPIFDVFDKIDDSLRLLKSESRKKVEKLTFLWPYERYKLVKPYIQAEEEKKLLSEEERKVVEESSISFNVEMKNDVETVISNEIDRQIKVEIENKTEEPTDEERVARIRDHFKQVSVVNINTKNKFPKIPKQDIIPLRQMKGCKRKRYVLESSDDDNKTEDPTIEQIAGPLTNVRPNAGQSSKRKNDEHDSNIDNKKKTKKRKRAQNYFQMKNFLKHQNDSNTIDMDSNPEGNTSNSSHKQQRNKPFKPKKIQENQEMGDNDDNERVPNPFVCKKQNVDDYKQKLQQEKQQHNQNKQRFNPNNAKKLNRRQRRADNRKNAQQPNSSNQNNQQTNWKNQNPSSVIPFDYNSVDFQRFQGGAGSTKSQTGIKQNFRGKNKSKIRGRNIGKGNNKSQFFGMNTNSRGGKNR